ncbi:MAG TPA: DUF5050 domain-containing protein [Acetivibrio sp.]|nr:DUF5050 domain-containing protein [Clostridium sp.]HOQ37284.1 DUF5050 domain-containing protein [Acetivibrio sp.]HPT90475.1 DUF5050 domain-containing protein [Acetivibrio sp.]HQA56574.1 DUF5050 domain-containing protein [Acetivibrio sp.]
MSSEKNNKNSTKIILIALPTLIIILAIVFISRFTSNKNSQPPFIKEMLNKPINLDLNVKNSLICSEIAATDEYIFYSNGNGLYRINKDGSNKLELEAGNISNINIYNNYLYYSKSDIPSSEVPTTNTTHYIIKQSFDGSDRTEVTTVSCQRVGSMLVANDIIIHRLVIFYPDGGKNALGNPTGRLESKYKAVSIDGKYNGDVSDEQYNNIMLLNFPFTQADLDASIRKEYSNVFVKSSKYYIDDTMYFEARSNQDPKFTAIFSISKKDNKLNLVTKYDQITENGYTSEKSLTGFCYSDKNLYFILNERRKYTDSRPSKTKMDLCKLDLSDNTISVIENIFTPEDF